MNYSTWQRPKYKGSWCQALLCVTSLLSVSFSQPNFPTDCVLDSTNGTFLPWSTRSIREVVPFECEIETRAKVIWFSKLTWTTWTWRARGKRIHKYFGDKSQRVQYVTVPFVSFSLALFCTRKTAHTLPPAAWNNSGQHVFLSLFGHVPVIKTKKDRGFLFEPFKLLAEARLWLCAFKRERTRENNTKI